jgi:hypothetical protein
MKNSTRGEYTVDLCSEYDNIEIEGVQVDVIEDVERSYFTESSASSFMNGDVRVITLYIGELPLTRDQAVLAFGESAISSIEDKVFDQIAENL